MPNKNDERNADKKWNNTVSKSFYLFKTCWRRGRDKQHVMASAKVASLKFSSLFITWILAKYNRIFEHHCSIDSSTLSIFSSVKAPEVA